MEELAPTTSLADDWCTVNEAARRLCVTATAIRNRIKRGTLETRPNGNFGRLVRVPRTVTLTPKEPVPGTVPLTSEEQVPLTVTLTVLTDHVATLRNIVAKGEAALDRERERAARLEQDLATVRADRDALQADAGAAPGLRTALDALKGALEGERDRARDLRAERDRLLRKLEEQTRRSWWPFRRAG